MDRPSRALLLAGDLIAILSFVVLGRLSHGLSDDWLMNLFRIATPFVLGWLVAATLLGAFRLNQPPGRFLSTSALALLVANLIAFGLRPALFQDRVTVPFALTSIAFTALLLLSWRFLFIRRLVSGQSHQLS